MTESNDIEVKRDEHGRPRVFLEGDDVPVRELSVECMRERGASSALPPLYFLHVWWARRPLTISRAAVLGSVLPEGTDRVEFLELLGVPRGKNPLEGRRIIDEIKAGIRDNYSGNKYGYSRGFTNRLPPRLMTDMKESLSGIWARDVLTVLDSFAGGGSIPFEACRMGFHSITNELNPVAVVIEKATLDYPSRFGMRLIDEIEARGSRIIQELHDKLSDCFPRPEGELPGAYIWIRTITCPECELSVPLAPNWWLDKGNGVGYRYILPSPDEDMCSFDVVDPSEGFDPDIGTVKRGVATCPRCHEPIDGDEVKRQAQNNEMGHQLAIVELNKIQNGSKVRTYRAVTEDDVVGVRRAEELLKERLPMWEARGIVPIENRYLGPADRSANYGVIEWSDIFNPRQLLVHLTTLETILDQPWNELDDEKMKEALRAYIQFAFDKTCDYNSIQSRLHTTRGVMVNTFDRHDFSFKWSYAEMDGAGHLFRFGLSQIEDAYRGIVKLIGKISTHATFINGDAASLSSISNGSVDCVVIDPPYYDNVMYAECSDFFYVWMKRGLGDVFPELFTAELTEKDAEAVANVARFKHHGRGKGRPLAEQDYEAKMAAAFQELYRVLRDDGVMTVMFTHKRVEAWDTLSKALMDAGFEITATWPVHTESEHSLHQAKKNAAQSTILLVCRKRSMDAGTGWWEDLKPILEEKVIEKAERLEGLGLSRLDLSIASFGPALEVISKQWPVKKRDGTVINPDEALDVARSVIVQWFMDKILKGHRSDVDQWAQFYILGWYIFEARRFPFDEARKLGIAVGVDVDDLIKKKVLEKKGNDVIIQTPAKRFRNKGLKAGLDSYKRDLDYVQASLYAYELGMGQELGRFHETTNALQRPGYKNAILALKKVLPDKEEVVEHSLLQGMWEAGLSDIDKS